jgi:prophage maintenance system killer protein/predicted XRE-type DNA-binding protein
MTYIPAMSTTTITAGSSAAIVPAADNAVYMAPSGELQLDVRIDSETVWLTQAQIAELFDVQVPAINKHLANVYEEGELERRATISKMEIVRQEGRRTVRRNIEHYSLDAIISVGYRVNSKTATAFRQWATRTIRERLIGAHRQRQLEQGRLEALGALASHVLTDEEARALLNIIGRFANSWQMLRQYDENQLPERPATPTRRMKRLTLRQAHVAVVALKGRLMQRGEASDLFGLEHSDGLASILGNIEQTFGGKALYPSVEERATALLYFVIKNHPFTDGNKRIGSLLFVHFLDKNSCLSRPDGSQRFDANALVAVALLVAESDPKQKETVMRLIMAMLS